jgi:hypothetical protein
VGEWSGGWRADNTEIRPAQLPGWGGGGVPGREANDVRRVFRGCAADNGVAIVAQIWTLSRDGNRRGTRGQLAEVPVEGQLAKNFFL